MNGLTKLFVAARVLATYLVPGCVGKGVRLGSENSSGGAGVGGVWARAQARAQAPAQAQAQARAQAQAQARAQAGNLEIWDPEIWKFEIQKNQKK